MNSGLDIPTPPARVLIVDDSPDNRELLEVMLNWEGFVTLTASNGEEALASAAEQLPDLMLLDLVLPDLSGHEVAAQMKKSLTTRHIPIMVMSGMSDSATRKRALSAGAEDFMTKPIDRSDLCQRMRKLLRLKTAVGRVAETQCDEGEA